MTIEINISQTLNEHFTHFFSSQDLSTWFTPLSFEIDPERKILVVTFPHVFYGQWFFNKKQHIFEQHIKNCLPSVVVRYKNKGAQHPFAQKHSSCTANELVLLPHGSGRIPLEDHTFATFLVNKKNDFPLAAAREAINNIAHPPYSPLTLYGQSGSGKTHLIEAMANAVREQKLTTPYFYGDPAEFLQFIHNQNNHDTTKEQAFFIDDGQNLAKEEQFQEQFIAYLDILQRHQKLIVITLDCHPGECRHFAEKLQLRLTSGLVVQLKKPDIAIRRQYIQQMNTEFALGLSKSDILSLAQRYTDFRTIIGTLTRIKAYKLLVTTESTDITQVIGNQDIESALTPEIIVATAAKFYGLPASEIKGMSRGKKVTRARQVCIFLCRELLAMSLMQIGHFFNGRDHSSIVYTIKKIKILQDSNKDIHNDLSHLKKLCTDP